MLRTVSTLFRSVAKRELQSRLSNSCAIWTAFVAAPLRRLSATTHRFSPWGRSGPAARGRRKPRPAPSRQWRRRHPPSDDDAGLSSEGGQGILDRSRPSNSTLIASEWLIRTGTRTHVTLTGISARGFCGLLTTFTLPRCSLRFVLPIVRQDVAGSWAAWAFAARHGCAGADRRQLAVQIGEAFCPFAGRRLIRGNDDALDARGSRATA